MTTATRGLDAPEHRRMVEAVARRRAAMAGITAEDLEIIARIDPYKEGVDVRRKAIGLEMGQSWTSSHRVATRITSQDENRITAQLDRFINRALAVKARRAAIDDADPPLWSLVAHPLLAHLLAETDCAHGLTRFRRTGESYAAAEYGFACDTGGEIARHVPKGMRVRGLAIDGGIVSGEIALEGGPVVMTKRRNAEITLEGTTLPDVLRTAARGRTLDQVLSHPRLDGAQAHVTSAADDRGLKLRLRQRLVPLGETPVGADDGWRRTIIAG